MLRFVYWIGCLVLGAATLIGLVAPLAPQADMINHFRLFLLAAAVLLVVLGAVVTRPGVPRAALGVLALNALLAGLALRDAAWPRLELSAAGADVKVVGFNLWSSDRHDDIAEFLRRENADVVVLQELQPFHRRELLPRLIDAYPHQAVCTTCLIGLLSRTPLSSVAHDENGRWVTGVWTSPRGQAVRLASVHLSWPFQPVRQARDIDDLIATARGWSEPMILAGDFNLTPWSWKLNKLTRATGLKRHGTLAASWPVAQRFSQLGRLRNLPWPGAVLIDNVLTSPGIEARSFATGPDLGSDHKPVVVNMTLR